jgi:hypothetical protein
MMPIHAPRLSWQTLAYGNPQRGFDALDERPKDTSSPEWYDGDTTPALPSERFIDNRVLRTKMQPLGAVSFHSLVATSRESVPRMSGQ